MYNIEEIDVLIKPWLFNLVEGGGVLIAHLVEL